MGYRKKASAIRMLDFLAAKPSAATIIGDIIITAGQGIQRQVTRMLKNRFINVYQYL